MRAFLVGTFLTLAISFGSTDQAGALSLLQTAETPRVDHEDALEPAAMPQETPFFLEKRSLPAITDAMRINREHRRMFADLTKESRGEDNPLTKYIMALDVRYAILSAVGDGLVRATTPEEVTEATAAADAVLAVRTDLDRVIGTTQMAIIDAARASKGYFGACDSRGQLADGTKCVRVSAENGGEAGKQSFWAQPWDAARFAAVPQP
ncbi:hypothetical protein [Rhizobium sp. BK176]|uniref:hypothetical protein n=1 Tax=Rhizobium sp. BK176 TaxID=2587071 RepID=UPI00216A165E|nr:hypothetical protein [Rhizobium sp. BK176]MCS4088691.1 hypothetical protein [Rhizobium sp. BK176]